MKRHFSWGRAIEVLGIVSVIGSLFVVAWEIRQNTNVARSAAMQSVSEMSYDAARMVIENTELRDSMLATRSGKLTDEQVMQLAWYVAAILRIQQNRFNQVKLGIVDLEQALGMGGRGALYNSPWLQEIWVSARDDYPQDFQQYMDKEVFNSAN